MNSYVKCCLEYAKNCANREIFRSAIYALVDAIEHSYQGNKTDADKNENPLTLAELKRQVDAAYELSITPIFKDFGQDFLGQTPDNDHWILGEFEIRRRKLHGLEKAEEELRALDK